MVVKLFKFEKKKLFLYMLFILYPPEGTDILQGQTEQASNVCDCVSA